MLDCLLSRIQQIQVIFATFTTSAEYVCLVLYMENNSFWQIHQDAAQLQTG